MKKLMFFMILVVATGTYTTSFAADSYQNDKQPISTNQKSTEGYLSNGSENTERITLVKTHHAKKANSDYKSSFKWLPFRMTNLLIKLSIVFSLIGMVILFQYLVPHKHSHN